MTDLYIAVSVAVVAGLAVMSFLNPEAYSRAFVPLAALVIAAWAGCSIWNAGVSAGTDAAAKFADLSKLNDAYGAGFALEIPDFWAKWVPAAAVVGLVLLRGLSWLVRRPVAAATD